MNKISRRFEEGLQKKLRMLAYFRRFEPIVASLRLSLLKCQLTELRFTWNDRWLSQAHTEVYCYFRRCGYAYRAAASSRLGCVAPPASAVYRHACNLIHMQGVR